MLILLISCLLQSVSSDPGNHLYSSSQILLISIISDTFSLQQRSLYVADPTQSVASGPGISNVAAGTTAKITVTAKDTNGVLLTSGADQFMVQISNRCTKENDYYCSSYGTSGPLSANINGMMTYSGSGIYSYDFNVPNSCKLFINNL